jgi:acyl dehydratase
MPLNLDYLSHLRFDPVETTLTDRDAMLYALSIGLGRNPEDSHDLRYVYERDLKVFPTMPLVVGHPGNWTNDPRTGVTRAMVVHGGQRLTTHCELPLGVPVTTTNKITGIFDKGERGAVVIIERESFDKGSGTLIARSESSVFCRADGGFGGPGGPAYEFQPIPDCCAQTQLEVSTPDNAALLYRLNQDRNPLHADPEIAHKAGFPRPVLHGLCTLGMAAVAIAKVFPNRTLRSIEARFSKPIFPGELMTIDLWVVDNEMAFRTRVAARNVAVLDRGRAIFD